MSPIAPSSIMRLAVTWAGYQRSGQLTASRTPDFRDGGEDSIGVGERGGERLLQENVDAERSDRLDAIGMARGCRAENGEVRLGLPHAALDIVKHAVGGNREGLDRVGHSRAVGIANADDFRVRMLVRLAQEVAHVDVFETDADDALLSHVLPPCLPQRVAAADLSHFGSAVRARLRRLGPRTSQLRDPQHEGHRDRPASPKAT